MPESHASIRTGASERVLVISLIYQRLRASCGFDEWSSDGRAGKGCSAPLSTNFTQVCYADVEQSRLDGRIEKALTEFPSIRSTYDQVERNFPEALASAMKEFRGAFPDFTPPMPVYLIHSLGTHDGGNDWVAGRMVMLF